PGRILTGQFRQKSLVHSSLLNRSPIDKTLYVSPSRSVIIYLLHPSLENSGLRLSLLDIGVRFPLSGYCTPMRQDVISPPESIYTMCMDD
ncbi:MAG: hypothetical protein P8Y80_01480, partial [Acidobacteriota bacterium]